MKICLWRCLLVLSLVSACRLASEKAPGQEITAANVKVTVDTSEVPELKDWGKTAGKLIKKWHPKISRLLASDGFTPPLEVRVVFKKDMKGVAATSGQTITIAADWIKNHPDDYGMVIHELTHVIQAYPKPKPGWLTEGIADYVRFFQYEPDTQLSPIESKANYKDGYRTSAAFLAWISDTYDPTIVTKLNAAMRLAKYKDKLFEKYTGHDLDTLWSQFLEEKKPRKTRKTRKEGKEPISR